MSKDLYMEFSCRRCTERTMGCHGSCETYKSERAEFDRLKAELNKNEDYRLYVVDSVDRVLNISAKRKQQKGQFKFRNH